MPSQTWRTVCGKRLPAATAVVPGRFSLLLLNGICVIIFVFEDDKGDAGAKGASMNLDVSTREVGDYLVFEVRGEVDLYSAPQLKQAVYETIDAGRTKLVFDLNALDFMDSTGLGILVASLKRLTTEGGQLKLVCNRDNILKIFKITGLDKVFEIYETVEASTGS